MLRRLALLTALAAVALPAGIAAAAPYDFNGDRRQDLTVGVPRHGQDEYRRMQGAVAVFPASGTGLWGGGRTFYQPAGGGGEFFDMFGSAVASADFDRDGFADMAATAPGSVGFNVLHGSAQGVTSERAQFFETGGEGGTLTAGDLNGDGYGDLALGEAYPGRITLFFGGPAGLSEAGKRTIARPGRRTGSSARRSPSAT